MTNEELLKEMSGPKYLIEKDIKLDDDIAESMLRDFKTSYWNLIDRLISKIELKTGDKYIYNCTDTKPKFMLVRIVGQGWILVNSNGDLFGEEQPIQNDLEIKIELLRYFTKVES